MNTTTEPDVAPAAGDLDDDVLHFVKFRNRLRVALTSSTHTVALCGTHIDFAGGDGYRYPPAEMPRCPICVELRGGRTR